MIAFYDTAIGLHTECQCLSQLGNLKWFSIFTFVLLQLIKTILEELTKTKGVRQNMLEVNLNGKQIIVT